MPTAQCLKNIANMPPPLNVPCPHICQDAAYIDETHCSRLGVPMDTPILTKDPNCKGPGQPCYCYCCCSCMAKNTPLEQTPSEFVLVEDVAVGDQLLVCGKDLNWRPGIVRTSSGDVEEVLYQGLFLLLYKFEEETQTRFLILTPDHLFMVAGDRTLKAVQYLTPGDQLLRNDGRAASVVFVKDGSYETGIFTIEMEGDFDGTNLDGHLLNANGLVTADYAVQAYYATDQINPDLLFAKDQELLQVGEDDYNARYGSPELDAFLQDKSAWPAGFIPLRKDLVNVPGNAKGFVIEDEAKQILDNGEFLPFNNQTPTLALYKLFGYMRGQFPNTIYLLDWNNRFPNAYSWTEAEQRFVLITGGLVRLKGLYLEGLALILGSVQSRLDGAQCVGDADYGAMTRVMRRIWADQMLPLIFDGALEQIKAVFDLIKVQPKDDVCNAPTTDCRMQAYQNGTSFLGVPACAKPVTKHFDLVSAKARPEFIEVVATFSDPCEVATATTTDNYTFLPAAQVTDAQMNPATPNNTQVVLKVDGLDLSTPAVLIVQNVLSATGQSLDPKHNSVIVTK
jgi:hypothetical protein